MRLHSRNAYAPHASAQGRSKRRTICVAVDCKSGDSISAGEVWQRLARIGSAPHGNHPPAARLATRAPDETAIQASASAEVDFAACAWKVLLRAAECPLEQARSDQHIRARTRHLHHRASSKPPASASERDLHRKAMFQARKGRSDEAARLLKVGLEQYPHNSFFPHSLGVMMSKRSRFEEAKKFLQLALDIDNGNSAALQALGRVYSQLGDGAQARDLFEEAVKARNALFEIAVYVELLSE